MNFVTLKESIFVYMFDNLCLIFFPLILQSMHGFYLHHLKSEKLLPRVLLTPCHIHYIVSTFQEIELFFLPLF